MAWFLYDRDLCHKWVKKVLQILANTIADDFEWQNVSCDNLLIEIKQDIEIW